MHVELSSIQVRAGERVIADVTLEIRDGERVALLGPSGAGKSTCLRVINGLIVPSRGTVRIDGRPLDDELRRTIGWVIQDGALFPHLDVARNVGFVPELLGWDRATIAARVDEVLALVGLDAERFRHARVRSLSGGERQRVGVVRAIAARPKLILLDEPFAALDPLLRGDVQRDVMRALGETTTVLVTHDVVEALTMSERIILLRNGTIVLDAHRDAFLRDPAAADYAASARAARDVLGAAL
jgi:osmoprotectant transport system ATP-binding protein